MGSKQVIMGIAIWLTAVITQAQWKSEAAFPNLGFTNPIVMEEAPRTGLIYVAEQDGRIYSFENKAATATKSLVLDISGQTQGGFGLEDCGLLGMAFHPDFGKAGSPNRGYVYVYYNYNATPVLPASPTVKISENTPTRDRLSRFTIPDGATAAATRSMKFWTLGCRGFS